MSRSEPKADQNRTAVEDLALEVATALDSLLSLEAEAAEQDLAHLLARARELVTRKREMSGTKSDTHALVAEHFFSRLRRTLRALLRSPDAGSEVKVAEWVLGAVVGDAALAELASIFDRTILSQTGPQDYSFAGRADFIAIEEVLQMLGSGKHTGCLSLEKHDNRLDLYIHRGQIAFLDPHHLVRRVLPGATPMDYREIGAEQLALAERAHREQRTPVVLSLHASGVFRNADVKAVVRQLGSEVLFDFLRAQEESYFSYRKLDALPAFATQHELRLGITPILLEITKRLDDWRSLLRVFPDPKAPLEPKPDMLARISNLSLGVVEIKLLTMINGETSPERLAQVSGLPIQDVYQLLVQLAQEGAIVTPGALEGVDHAISSVQDSLRAAFDALDANDDNLAVESALDRVLGDSLGGALGGGSPPSRPGGRFNGR
ncbi:MAG: DUF4388 domain-containing protein [Planctomycetota bacterium]